MRGSIEIHSYQSYIHLHLHLPTSYLSTYTTHIMDRISASALHRRYKCSNITLSSPGKEEQHLHYISTLLVRSSIEYVSTLCNHLYSHIPPVSCLHAVSPLSQYSENLGSYLDQMRRLQGSMHIQDLTPFNYQCRSLHIHYSLQYPRWGPRTESNRKSR